MTGNIYILQGDQLIGVEEAPYPKEEVLQRQVSLFADQLIPGAQVDPDKPRRWLLVTDEAGVPNAEGGGAWWWVDHLFLDQDGIPTLVEVKRSSNTQIRREVVGQMLDYAANALQFWTVNDMQGMFERHVQKMLERDPEGEPCDVRLKEFLQGEQTEEEFWLKAKTNLQARRIRMVFVADRIPPELQRIVEFLNSQMDPAEVLAVEIKHYDGAFDGKQVKALVPQVLGTNVVKAGSVNESVKRKWTEGEFMAALRDKRGEVAATTAKRILDWAIGRGLTIWWGEGKREGSFYPMLYEGPARLEHYFTFAALTNGAVQIQFGTMLNRAVFSDEEQRAELLKKLNSLLGVAIPEPGLTKYPSLPITLLADENSLQQFLSVWDWYLESIRNQAMSEKHRARITSVTSRPTP